MDLSKITPLLQTNKPTEIFKKIVSYNEQTQEQTQKAKLRIGLASGFILEGTPLKMDDDGNSIFITMNDTISYVNVHTLSGVEVLNPEVVLELLTNGDFFNVPKDDVPTNLQLKRTFKSQAEKMESQYGFKVQSELIEHGLSTEAEKYQFDQFLKILDETLTNIAKESIGKAALLELQDININADDEQINLAKTDDQLQVGINFKNKFTTDFKDRLKAAFESKL